MAGLAVRETVTLAGRPERARVARAFAVRGARCRAPCGDDAALLVSELFGNSVQHSGSGAAGETVTVAVRTGDGVVRVEVTDHSGPEVPGLCSAGGDAECGRGFSSSRRLRRGGGGGRAAGGR